MSNPHTTLPRILPIKWVHCPQCGRSLAPALDDRKREDHITCSACQLCFTCERDDDENKGASDSPESGPDSPE